MDCRIVQDTRVNHSSTLLALMAFRYRALGIVGLSVWAVHLHGEAKPSICLCPQRRFARALLSFIIVYDLWQIHRFHPFSVPHCVCRFVFVSLSRIAFLSFFFFSCAAHRHISRRALRQEGCTGHESRINAQNSRQDAPEGRHSVPCVTIQVLRSSTPLRKKCEYS